MELNNNEIIIEKSKDGNYTCKVKTDNTWKYIYSKYSPKRSIKLTDIGPEDDCILLGLGLGYELEEILKKSNKKVYVIDKDDFFYEAIKSIELLNQVLHSNRVKFLFGEDYGKIEREKLSKLKIVYNSNLIQLNSDYFTKVIREIEGHKVSKKEMIIFFSHITISDDSIDALEKLGYEVKRFDWYNKEKMIIDISKENPKYLFTINFSKIISEISEKLDIPYISWTVDTPSYSLYDMDIFNENNILFIYDYKTVEKLKNRGVKNIYYMPVAANTSRLDKISTNPNDIIKYQADTGFLGDTGYDNEYNLLLKSKLSENSIKKMEYILQRQRENPDNFNIPNSLDINILKQIEAECNITVNSQLMLSNIEKLSYYLGRLYNHYERINLIKQVSDLYTCKVYGDEYWRNIQGNYLKYMGQAEHFLEMPKVFKLSKININLTRVYVESGLPMRVFDVLGSRGFLATNYKEDISKYFKDGRDLVVYRDVKDLIDICDYYLNHEEKRQEILNNGYRLVKEEHTYDKRLRDIMSCVKKHQTN